jgi:hypothetical protein
MAPCTPGGSVNVICSVWNCATATWPQQIVRRLAKTTAPAEGRLDFFR